MGFLSRIANFVRGGSPSQALALPAKPSAGFIPPRSGWGWSGEQFPTGIDDAGTAYEYGYDDGVDYVSLRARSASVFRRNMYARGLLRRLVVNEIHSGLTLEATPVAKLVGLTDEQAVEWSDDVEAAFRLWAVTPAACDYRGRWTFGQLQGIARLEALIGGDCLVVLRQHVGTKLPTVEIVPADQIVSNLTLTAEGNVVRYGVEFDSTGKHVAYHVISVDGSGGITQSRRVEAVGKSGRRTAWMVYGSDIRANTVRGEPLLGVVLQSLLEINKYRNSAQRKAVVNSFLAMFVRKDQDKPASHGLTGGAVRKDAIEVADGDGTVRDFNISKQIPGLVIEELQHGEVPVGFDQRGIDLAFPEFERAVLAGIAWCNNIPPESLVMSYNSNYAASQGARDDFGTYLQDRHAKMGADMLSPIYADWLLSQELLGNVTAPGLREAFTDPAAFEARAAWTDAEWAGVVRPNADPVKTVKAMKLAIDEGLMTRTQATRAFTGRKYHNNVMQLARENEQLAEANKHLAPAEEPARPKPAPGDDAPDTGEDVDEDVGEESDEK